jgi:hypothetical protein
MNITSGQSAKMIRTEFNKENFDIIKSIMSEDTTQESKFYNLQKSGFKLFDGSLGRTQRDCFHVHKNKKDNIVKVQLETGFGFTNYSKYVYFNS